METQKTLTSQNSLGKELSWRKSIKYKADFILYYKDIVIKTIWSWHKNRSMKQHRKTRNEPMHLSQFFYGKGDENI